MNRFVDRTMTIQESIWLQKGGQGDTECMVLWLESRLNEDNEGLNIRDMPETELPKLVTECLEGCSQALEVERYMEKLTKQLCKDPKT